MMAAKVLEDEVVPVGLVSVGDHRNEVVLVGLLGAAAQTREMSSGDVVVSWRIVVTRPQQAQRADGTPTRSVDSLDCVAWRKAVCRSVLAWQAGDTIEVTGALHKRFWRTDRGSTSRTEVEVVRARRIAKAR